MPLRVEESKVNDKLLGNVEQLKSLKKHLQAYATDDPDWIYDVDAVDYAIKELERHG